MRVNLLDVRLSRLLRRHCDLIDLIQTAFLVTEFSTLDGHECENVNVEGGV